MSPRMHPELFLPAIIGTAALLGGASTAEAQRGLRPVTYRPAPRVELSAMVTYQWCGTINTTQGDLVIEDSENFAGVLDFRARPGGSSAETPWMRRKDWACGRIRCVGVANIGMLWVMALLWNGFTWTWMILIWGDPNEEDVSKVLSLFSLIGLGLFVWAVRRTWASRRFGESVLELASIRDRTEAEGLAETIRQMIH